MIRIKFELTFNEKKPGKKLKKFFKPIRSTLKKKVSPGLVFSTIVLSCILALGINLVFAWTDPTASPPSGNVAAPINVSSTSQTKTGTLRVDGGFQVDGNWVIDSNAGWHRTYGQTGWYNGTYGGGWYMTDTTWIRAYNNKSIITGGDVRGGKLCIGADCRSSWPSGGGIACGDVPGCEKDTLDTVCDRGSSTDQTITTSRNVVAGNGQAVMQSDGSIIANRNMHAKGALITEGEFTAKYNHWGNTWTAWNFGHNDYRDHNCPNGYYVRGFQTYDNGKIWKMYCSQL